MKTKEIPFAWDRNFPAVCGHTSISFLTQSADFYRAKHGDLLAAKNIVTDCIKAQRLTELRHRYPHAELLPVMTENKLPIVFAQTIGLRICGSISACGGGARKHMNAMERLLCQPLFIGRVKSKTDYIIVDDIVTQGGTVGALRKHILTGGGRVVAVTALAYALGSKTLAPTVKNICCLEKKFGYKQIRFVLQKYLSIKNPNELTNSQVLYLLRFNGIDGIIKKIDAILLQRRDNFR